MDDKTNEGNEKPKREDTFRYSEYYKRRMQERFLREQELKKKEEVERVNFNDSDHLSRKPLIASQKYSNEEKLSIMEELKKQFLQIPKHIRVLKWVIVFIMVLIIAFVLYKNFVSSEEFNYFYDVGKTGENYLSPNYRITQQINDGSNISDMSLNYRNLTHSLVYFNADIPPRAKQILVEVKVKNIFPNTTSFRLGAKDQLQWHYQWHELYNPIMESFSENRRLENVYVISPELKSRSVGDLESSEGYVIGTTYPVSSQPYENITDYKKDSETIINTGLRGGHSFYIYISGDLNLEVEKQDINWYNGSDEMDIILSDSSDEVIANTTIPDDGIYFAGPNKNSNNVQDVNFTVKGLDQGVYKIDFSDFDGLIRKIKINTNKIIVSEKVYLADSNIFFNGIEKPSTLYTEFNRNSALSFKTWHKAGLQTITLNGNPINLQQISTPLVTNFGFGDYNIRSEKNDIIVEAPGYFAFSEDNYFEPFKNRIVKIRNNVTWIEENLDYLISDYIPVSRANTVSSGGNKNGDWIITKTYYNLDELYIVNNKLNLVLNTPHLNQDDYNNLTLPIDWVNITIYKPGAF